MEGRRCERTAGERREYNIYGIDELRAATSPRASMSLCRAARISASLAQRSSAQHRDLERSANWLASRVAQWQAEPSNAARCRQMRCAWSRAAGTSGRAARRGHTGAVSEMAACQHTADVVVQAPGGAAALWLVCRLPMPSCGSRAAEPRGSHAARAGHCSSHQVESFVSALAARCFPLALPSPGDGRHAVMTTLITSASVSGLTAAMARRRTQVHIAADATLPTGSVASAAALCPRRLRCDDSNSSRCACVHPYTPTREHLLHGLGNHIFHAMTIPLLAHDAWRGIKKTSSLAVDALAKPDPMPHSSRALAPSCGCGAELADSPHIAAPRPTYVSMKGKSAHSLFVRSYQASSGAFTSL